MSENEIPSLPLGLQMALAHNARAMYAFLKLDNGAQDKIIETVKNTKTKREVQQIVDKIPENRLE